MTTWLKNIKDWTGLMTPCLFKITANTVIWISVISNIHREWAPTEYNRTIQFENQNELI